MKESPPRLLARPASSLLLVVDIQEKFVPVIHEAERVIERSARMIQAAKVLGLPVVLTEQYPKGLGRTVSDVLEPAAGAPVYQKTTFSCLVPEVVEQLDSRAVETLILVGIEAHVCVLQTALQALERGLAVHVVRDATSSRKPEDTEAALARLIRAGGVATTSEMTILELLGDAGSPAFKQLLPLIK